jgi:hypothetical protein
MQKKKKCKNYFCYFFRKFILLKFLHYSKDSFNQINLDIKGNNDTQNSDEKYSDEDDFNDDDDEDELYSDLDDDRSHNKGPNSQVLKCSWRKIIIFYENLTLNNLF